MSFEALQERLAALQETTAQLQELIDRLANLKFQPGSVPLSSDEGDNVGTELGSEISQILREEEEDLEVLQEEIKDLRSGRPGSETEHGKARLKDGAKRLEEELKTSRVSFCKAQLAARRSLQSAQRQERSLLLASYATPPARSGATTPSLDDGDGSGADGRERLFPAGYVPPHRRRHHTRQRTSDSRDGGDGSLVGAASDVTTALRRTHDLMAGEVAKSAFARQTLAQSTAALQQLDESYGSLDALLAGSRDLLGTLLRSQKSDTWYLETALYLLVGTLGWLVFRRWLYGPLWWLVWFPVRTLLSMAFWTGKSAVGVSRGGGGGESRARMEVVGGVGTGGGQQEGARIVGMDEDGVVPTAKVGQEQPQHGSNPGSLTDEVGRIVDGESSRGDGSTDQRDGTNQSDDGAPRNPKKRIWEEDREAAKEAQRARDEL